MSPTPAQTDRDEQVAAGTRVTVEELDISVVAAGRPAGEGQRRLP